ncbi:glycosyltransferase family 2 protein [Gammaproteobacteria bacterium]|nr:glycosyltransferase family 2 protein [Gammaproteobacteria bacterium]
MKKMSQNRERIDYSIVIPVYYNEGCLTKTFNCIHEEVILANPDLACEIIFVDDGSGDGSLEELLLLRGKHPRLIKVIKLTRNFGQQNAIIAGHKMSVGRCVITMSADGQDPANLINEMLKAHFEDCYEVVICEREAREESVYRQFTSKVFYKLMQKLSFPNMPEGGFDYTLVGRKAMNVLLSNLETHPFYQGQILWTGFTPKFLKYRRRERVVGKSRWTFGKKITYLIDGVMGYSFLPIRLMSVGGLITALLGFVYAVVIFVSRLVWGNPMIGWAPLMIVVLVLGGIQMLMLGMMGEYLWRTLAQSRNRDHYVIDRIYQ